MARNTTSRAPTQTKRAPTPTGDGYSFSQEEAAKAARIGYDEFRSFWDDNLRGWHIPIGNTTAFIPSIGHTRRRVPKARLYEIVAQGRTDVA